MTRKNAERQEAIERLREEIKPGDTIYTILRHRSRSGMQRSISVIQIDSEGVPREWDYLAARAMGDKIDNVNGGVKVSGCGMDMGFHLVYNLSRTLFPHGFGCVGEGEVTDKGTRVGQCRSNDHTNGDRDYTPHETIMGCPETLCRCKSRGVDPQSPEGCQLRSRRLKPHWHKDGGYALRHVWL